MGDGRLYGRRPAQRHRPLCYVIFTRKNHEQTTLDAASNRINMPERVLNLQNGQGWIVPATAEVARPNGGMGGG